MSSFVRRRRPASLRAAAACAAMTAAGLAAGCRSVPPQAVADAPHSLPPLVADGSGDGSTDVRLAGYDDGLPVLTPDPTPLRPTRNAESPTSENGSVQAF